MNSVIAGFGTKDGTDGADWWIKYNGRLPEYDISSPHHFLNRHFPSSFHSNTGILHFQSFFSDIIHHFYKKTCRIIGKNLWIVDGAGCDPGFLHKSRMGVSLPAYACTKKPSWGADGYAKMADCPSDGRDAAGRLRRPSVPPGRTSPRPPPS